MIERRVSRYIEKLSMVLVVVSSIGAILVLVDPVISFAFTGGTTIKIGGTGFSDQLKGAVVSLILVGGFSAVISYWLGASNQGDKAQDSVNTMAQQAAPTSEPIKTDEVNVTAKTATVNTSPQPKGKP